MKNLKKTHFDYLFVLLLVILLMALNACSEDNIVVEKDPIGVNDPDSDPDPTPDPIGTEDPDANKISESLSFKNSIAHAGELPKVNSNGILNVAADTISIITQVDLPPIIGISRKDGSVLQTSTTYVQVQGSETYYEAELSQVENDTLVFLEFDFEDTGWEYPLTFNLDVTPIDDSGTPIDSFTLPVVVEEESAPSGSCTIEEFLNGKQTMSYSWGVTWDKIEKGSSLLESDIHSFVDESGIFLEGSYTLPGDPKIFVQDVSGCCTSSGSLYSNCIGFPTHRVVEGETRRTIGEVYLQFFRDGAVSGSVWSWEVQNVDPPNFDFCNDVPAYIVSNQVNYYVGDYTFNPNDCSITITSFEGQSDPVIGADGSVIGQWPRPIYSGYGTNVKYTKHGTGIKSVRTDVEVGGTTLVKYYWPYERL